jgi:ribosomal protein S17E
MDLVNKSYLTLVDFTIFIRNKETKSGATELSYKQLRAAIAGFMSEDFNRAKAHFGNYTTKTTQFS